MAGFFVHGKTGAILLIMNLQEGLYRSFNPGRNKFSGQGKARGRGRSLINFIHSINPDGFFI